MKPVAMGAVWVKVKLTNAIDEALVSRGVLAPHLLRHKLDLLVDCKNQRLVPNRANPDYPVATIK